MDDGRKELEMDGFDAWAKQQGIPRTIQVADHEVVVAEDLTPDEAAELAADLRAELDFERWHEGRVS